MVGGYDMQVSLNTRVEHEIAQTLKQASDDMDRSQASIIAEALMEWFDRNGIPRMDSGKLTNWITK